MMSYGVREGKVAMFCARTPILVGNAMGGGRDITSRRGLWRKMRWIGNELKGDVRV